MGTVSSRYENCNFIMWKGNTASSEKRMLKKEFRPISDYQYLPDDLQSQVVSLQCEKTPCVANCSGKRELNEKSAKSKLSPGRY